MNQSDMTTDCFAHYLRWTKPSASELPCLSAGFLDHHGYLLDNPTGPAFETRGVKVIPIRNGRHVGLFTLMDGEIFFTEIEFDLFTVASRCMPHFVCPITSQLTNNIYFYNHFWASSKGHRLRLMPRGRSQRAKRRHDQAVTRLTTGPTHNRHHKLRRPDDYEQVKSRVRSLGFIPNGYEDLKRVFEAEAAAAQARQLRLLRDSLRSPTSLVTAIEGGHEATPETVRRLTAAWKSSDERPSVPEVQYPLSLEKHPCLDLNALRKSGLLDREGSWAWHLHWPLWFTDYKRLTLYFHDEPTEVGLMVQIKPVEGEPRFQKIDFGMRHRMGLRLFLKCPVAGTLHDKLYLRNGHFASEKAQRLYRCSR